MLKGGRAGTVNSEDGKQDHEGQCFGVQRHLYLKSEDLGPELLVMEM